MEIRRNEGWTGKGSKREWEGKIKYMRTRKGIRKSSISQEVVPGRTLASSQYWLKRFEVKDLSRESRRSENMCLKLHLGAPGSVHSASKSVMGDHLMDDNRIHLAKVLFWLPSTNHPMYILVEGKRER